MVRMRAQIVDAVISQIEAEGDASVRLRDIAAAVGIAEPSLYHYFSGREELITAAHSERYRRNLAETIDPFVAAVRSSASREEFVEVFRRLYAFAFRPERAAVRETRADIIGSSLHRPHLHRQIAQMTRESLDSTVEVLRFAQEKGWLRGDIDPTAFSFWNMAHMSSLLYAELQNDEEMVTAFKKIALEAVVSIVLNDSDPNAGG
jgi:AcrR family transcriptional regulator